MYSSVTEYGLYLLGQPPTSTPWSWDLFPGREVGIEESWGLTAIRGSCLLLLGAEGPASEDEGGRMWPLREAAQH